MSTLQLTKLPAHALVAGILCIAATPVAAEGAELEAAARPGVEEIVITGRQLSSATNSVQERMHQPVVSDYISAVQIERVGDTTVAAALRRVPGVTLVNEQFVYVRGLGERYSSTLLNSAEVPSPDLTRNVIPLDLFPTTIIDALGVQKAYSPNMPAAFGGGAVGIKTRGVPDGRVASLEVGSGWNSDSTSNGVKYVGGDDDALGTDDGTRRQPKALIQALTTYRGDLSAPNIFETLQNDGRFHTFDEAEAINRELITTLNRNVNLADRSLDPDLSAEVALGDRWYFLDNEDLEIGVLGVGAYNNQWRNRDRVNRSSTEPDVRFFETERTVEGVTMTGAANFGARYTDDHEITTSNLWLRNTEDEASVSTGYNATFARADGRQLRNYRLRWEERDLNVFQVSGRHVLGDATIELADSGGLGFLPLELLQNLTFNWHWSDSDAETDIPNEVAIAAEDTIVPNTGELLTTRVRATASAADYRFTELTDDVESSGWSLMMPVVYGEFHIELSGGQDYTRKGREYLQNQYFIGSTSITNDAREGLPEDVFSDEKIVDPVNGFAIATGGIGTESYLAGQITDAAFGMVDVLWNETWRVAGGVRWEQFQQTSVPINTLEFDPNVGQIPIPPEGLQSFVFQEDDLYPGVALTWIRPDFWAETFQLRFGFSETVGRPDIREISQATYIDPLTEARVTGNPDLVTSQITNFDVRGEWFFDSGDNLTVSLFYKDISDPIETVQTAGTDDNVTYSFINAEAAEVYGIELEWLKDLAFISEWLGEWSNGFFVAGNFTLSDSEIEIGDAATDLTNDRRSMTEHSDYVVNFQLGYDSPGGDHAATLVYNVFDERLFFAGRQGGEDAYEQPFNSLDVVYTWYALEQVSLKVKLKNMLDERLEIEQGGTTIIEQDVGTSASVELKWAL